jgi:hypothetical protein
MSSCKAARRATSRRLGRAVEPCPAGLPLDGFPVCRWLAGEALFAAMARAYTDLPAPRSPEPVAFGEDFGAFIDGFGPAGALPCLGDLARLEAARERSAAAPNAVPLGAEELASVPSCAWEQARLALHPSIEIVRSAHPIVSILEACAAGRVVPAVPPRRAEDALVQRRGRAVAIRCLPSGAAVFLGLLMTGSTVAEARAAASAEPGFDMVASLALLFAERMIVGLAHAGCGPRPERRAVPAET